MRSTTMSSSSSALTLAAAWATAPGSAVNGAPSQGAAAAGGGVGAERAAPAPDGKARPARASKARSDFRVLLSLRDIASPGGEGAPGLGRWERDDFSMPFRRGRG